MQPKHVAIFGLAKVKVVCGQIASLLLCRTAHNRRHYQCYENDKKHIDTGLVNITIIRQVIAIFQALCKILPESLHLSRDEASVGNVQLWRAEGLMIGVLDGEDVGQLKYRT